MMLAEGNCGLVSLDDFRAERAAAAAEQKYSMVRSPHGGWRRVEVPTPEAGATPEPVEPAKPPAQPELDMARFVVDLTYQDRPDLDPRALLVANLPPEPARYEEFTD